MNINFVGRIFLLLVSLSGTGAQAEAPGSGVFQKGDTGIEPCAECHAADGRGSVQFRTPAIAGQSAVYLAKQLLDFRAGLRSSPVMEPIARQLNASQSDQVTAFIATLPAPAPIAVEYPENARQLALFGQWDSGIPPCDKCHGKGGRGIPPHFPALSGQISVYTIDTLEDFRKDKRRNDPMGLMRKVAKALSLEDLSATAHYYQAQRRWP